MEVGLKNWHGFVGVGEAAPFATCDVEETCGVHDVVALSNDGRHGGRVIACRGKTNAVFELRKKDFDGRRRDPGGGHAEQVGVKFRLGDAAVVVPEMEKELEAGDVAKTESVIVERTNVRRGGGEDELIAKSLVGLVVGAEGRLGRGVEAVDFGDLGRCGLGGMFWLRRRVCGRNKSDAGEEEIIGGGDGKGKMAVDAISGVGGDGGGVAVELGLGDADGGVGGLAGGGGGERSEDGSGEGGGDGRSGGSGGRGHDGEVEKNGVEFINFC